MRTHTKLVEETVQTFMRAMRSTSQATRIRKYRAFMFNQDDVRWIAPRYANEVWQVWEPTCKAIAEALTQQYRSTMPKPGADEISLTAYPIGRRSVYWPRYRDTYKHFPRLPPAYWVKTIAPWYEHNSMPYLYLRGRVIFWPALDRLVETYRQLDDEG